MSSVNRSPEVTEVLDCYNFNTKYYHAWRILIGLVVGKVTLVRQKSEKSIIMKKFQLNLQKYFNLCGCSFNKISIKRKNLFCKKF